MAALTLREISEETYRHWFEQNAPVLRHRSPFHDPAWLSTVGRGVRFEVRFVGIHEGSELVAAVPGFLTRRGPFKLFGSPLRGTMTSYLGPVGLFDGRDEDLVELVTACSGFARRRWGVVYTRFSLRDAPSDGRPTLDTGWRQQTPRSYRLDLTAGSEALWARLESDCRRNVRKAQRLGIETVAMGDAHLFYEMLDETLRRHDTTSWQSERFFHDLIENLTSRDLMWNWGARYDGKVVSAGLFLHDDNEVHFVSGASRPEYGSLPTSYLLHWHAIETGARAGLRSFHSEASHVPSIDQFKESFRPAFEERYTLIWAPSYVRRAEKAFKMSYARFRRLKSRLGRRR
jgi:hypothetical protein